MDAFSIFFNPLSFSICAIIAKKKNSAKIPTHMTTLELLKENVSIKSIAEKRGLTIGTIIAHIEKLKGLKKIENASITHLKDAIPKKDFHLILTALEKSDDGSLTSIYNIFQGKYSYDDIKVVRLFVK